MAAYRSADRRSRRIRRNTAGGTVGHGAVGTPDQRNFQTRRLGPIDAIGGILLGVFKMAVILSLLLYAFETVNSTTRWVENDRYTEAALYKPVRSTTALLFPYLDLMKNKITGNND